MSLVRRCRAAFAACTIWLCAGPPAVYAASLSKEDCDKLYAEQAELTAAGVREQELDEKGNPIPPKAAPAGDPASKSKAVPKAKQPVKAKDAKGLDGAAAASASAKPKAKAAPEVKGKAASDAQSKPTAAKAAPKPRVKPDDAYRPAPDSTPNADPFAAQRPAIPKQ